MLSKPPSCEGCSLEKVGGGFMAPSLAQVPLGVTLIGEALGADEAEAGAPFVGKAGFRLNRLIEWAGFQRSNFDILNTVWCRPPDNKLEGMPFESSAIAHCRRAHWAQLLERSRVLVPLGNVASAQFIGRKGILNTRGYVYPAPNGQWVVPTVHPSFIQRGQARWSAPFIADLRKAVQLAQQGMPPQVLSYELDPSPLRALEWARAYLLALQMDPRVRLAFDIETPGKGDDEDELELGEDGYDQTWNIERIGFSYEPLSALSIPWSAEYIPAIRALLGSAGEKVVWNAGFDVPRIRRAGIRIEGTVHDGMVAWHILHSDLPKSLKFVATFTCPWQPAWKHLSGSKPQFYNATDADVELRSMLEIERGLREANLWEVYQRDVVELEPVLAFMAQAGMPVDAHVREDRALKLAEELKRTHEEMTSLVPEEARKIEHVYISTPKDTTGLLSRPGTRTVRVCSTCGLERPRKEHFKRFVKKANPCSAGVPEDRVVSVTEYYRLGEFTPSRDQLTRYHQVLNRPLPMTFDKKERKRKVSFAEKQIKELQNLYPDDKIYPLILRYREIDKLAGTYVGRPVATIE